MYVDKKSMTRKKSGYSQCKMNLAKNNRWMSTVSCISKNYRLSYSHNVDENDTLNAILIWHRTLKLKGFCVYSMVYNLFAYETKSEFSVLKAINKSMQFSEDSMCFFTFVSQMLSRNRPVSLHKWTILFILVCWA